LPSLHPPSKVAAAAIDKIGPAKRTKFL